MPETVRGALKEAAVNAFMDTVHQAAVVAVAWAGALIALFCPGGVRIASEREIGKHTLVQRIFLTRQLSRARSGVSE